MATGVTLKRRIGRAFLIQTALIGAAAVLGVFAAGFMLEEVLIKQALRQEAEYFWSRNAEDPSFPLPDTLNLTGYMDGRGAGGAVPHDYRGLAPGFHRVPPADDFSVLYVSEKNGKRLYLVFLGERVRELALYFGLVPLALVLLALYLSVWLGYRGSQRAVSPVAKLAHAVNDLDPQAPDAATFERSAMSDDAGEEVRVLASALARFAERLNAFVERERHFTRDASHELRSPLTVIRIAADMLLGEHDLDQTARKSVMRIKRAAADMEELMEALLLLARESEQGLSAEEVCLNDVVTEELERARMAAGEKPIALERSDECRLVTTGSEKALSVLVGNLLRNAYSYTDAGRIRVVVRTGELVIEDSGIGIPEQQVGDLFKPYFRANPGRRGGHGVGLTIVKRLSDRFNWPVRIDSQPGVGTIVTVSFPNARCGPVAAGD
jgi:signal transduction histidine kinase